MYTEENMSEKFYLCEHCKNLVGMVASSGVPLVCCGEKMKALVANTTDASKEKHLPVISYDGDKLTVDIGSIEHPMSDEHFILWIFVETEHGGQRKALKPTDKPHAQFVFIDDKPIAVYAYCNLHGLWKTIL